MIDGFGKLRSKARTLPGPVADASELPKWNFTVQALVKPLAQTAKFLFNEVKGGLKGRKLSQLQQGKKFGNKQTKNRFVVRASAKEIASDQKSRASMQAGIDKLADAVGLTLGPRDLKMNSLWLPEKGNLLQ